jgi:hypothetical protein
MKKLIFITIALITGLASLQAQVKLPVDKYIYSYTGVSSDTAGAGTTTWSKEIFLNKLDGLYYNAKVIVSDYSAGATCTVALQGKMFESDSYSTITTLTWHGGGTDTTLLYTQNTNKIYYRYLKFLVTRTASKVKVTSIDLSLKK